MKDRDKTKDAFRKSEEKYRTMFDTLLYGAVYQDENGEIISANPAAEDILGLSVNQMQGRTSVDSRWKSIHEDGSDFPGETHPAIVALRTGKPVTNTIMGVFHPEKEEYRWININAVPQFQQGEKKPFQVYTTFEDITHRKQTEEEILKSEKLWKSLFENSPDYIALLDLDLNITFVNRTIPSLAKEDVIGKSNFDFVPAEYHQVMSECFDRVRKTGKVDLFETNYIATKEETQYFEVRVSRMTDIYGNINGFISNTSNITERKLAEEAFAASLQLSEDLFRTSFSGIYVYEYQEPDRLILVDANAMAEKLTGVKLCDWKGREFNEIWTQAREDGWTDTYLEVLRSGKTVERDNIVYEDKQVSIAIRAKIFQLPNQRVAVSFEDISERKKAEEKLQLNQYYPTKAQEIGSIGTWELDLIKNELIWTDQNYLNFGVPIGTPLTYEIFLDCVHPDDRDYVNTEWMAAIDGKPYDIEHRLIVNDKVRWVREKADIEFDAKGTPVIAIGFTQDITKHKLAKEEIRTMNESLKLLNRRLQEVREEERTLISREIHDQLGQSLTALKIDMEWLSRKIASDSEEDTKLQGMVDLMTQLAKDVQRVSTELRPPMLDDIGLSAAMEWYSGEFEKRTGINCLLKLDDVQFPNEKKSIVLYRILQEALTNVIRHSKAKNVNLSLYQAEDSIFLEVIDDGIGIERDKIDSNKSLGLLGMRERLKQYDGRMEISSALKKGTKLTVSLPFD